MAEENASPPSSTHSDNQDNTSQQEDDTQPAVTVSEQPQDAEDVNVVKPSYNPANNDSFEDIPAATSDPDGHYQNVNVIPSSPDKIVVKDTDTNVIALKDMIEAITLREKAVTKNGDSVMQEIRHQAQRLVEQVTRMETAQVDLVHNTMQHKLYFLNQQKEEAEKALAKIKDKQGPPKLNTPKVNAQMYHPGEQADIKFTLNKSLVAKVEELGVVSTGYAFIPQSPPGSKSAVVGEPSSTGIVFKTKEGFPMNIPPSSLKCTLTSPTGKDVACAVALTNERGKYAFTYLPKERGRHALSVKIHGVSVCGDITMTLGVVPSVSMREKPIGVIESLSNPWGIAVNKSGQIFISEHSRNRADFVTVFDKNFKEVRTFPQRGSKETKLCKPRGIALTDDGHFIVTDEHRLCKISLDGKLADCIKGEESLQTSFQFPRGVAIHPTTGQIYVADHGNHCVQVINPDFTHSHNFVTKKSNLKLPHDVAIDREGKHVYVTNTEKNCIDVYKSDGTYVHKFGKRGLGKGELIRPIGVTVDEFNQVYVTEDRRVSIFSGEGTFLRHLGYDTKGNRILKEPCGIAIDKVGQLYVVDAGRNEVLIY